ncbi:fructosamine kinase family protein [Spelaeicoccus albus]|uniref:Fructosamine-3-kinase n=1 Tax=Spelaeicoccus albus TaxID=1280376 RepID=A0A7Z0IH64_9MICO|nr:fructosamine kinase family protein [Spelaeicoccus albus]NYI67565.1 fructosamine-3-kinase [Spelaeicoccus albus]
MAETFTKREPGADPDFFAAQAAGLRWLADAGGVHIVGVRDVGSESIELERVREVGPDIESARRFGRDLAVMHAAGAASFGAPPPGYSGTNFIGSLAQPCKPEASWGVFYARQRVLPFVDMAVEAGNLRPDAADDVRRACDLIESGEFDDGESPARLHGDIWAGNVLWTPEGVVLIDPAAHGGHRETDLAMLALFGCPYLDDILEAYDKESPLRDGWRERIPLHQLHPLAVHAAGHGPSYGAALHDSALAVLRARRSS